MAARFIGIVFFAFLFCLPGIAQAQDKAPIAAIAEIEGTATISHAGVVSAAAIGAPLHLGDELVTGPDSKAHILFIDETEITLGQDASLMVDGYVFDAANPRNNKGHFSVLRGAFVFVSGLIAESEEPHVNIRVPYGSIGIRGTTVWGGQFDDEYGVLVLDGEVTVKTERGNRRIGTNQGTFLRSATSIPSRAAVWGPERVQTAIDSVTLQNADAVKTRVAEMKAQHKAMREGHKQNLIDKEERREEQKREEKRVIQEKRQEEQKEIRHDVKDKEAEPGLHQTTKEQFLKNETGYETQKPEDELNKPIVPQEEPAPEPPADEGDKGADAAIDKPLEVNDAPVEKVEEENLPAREAVIKDSVVETTGAGDINTPVQELLDHEETTTRHRIERMDEQLEELRDSENSAHEMELLEKHHMENIEEGWVKPPAPAENTGSSRGF